MKRNCIALLLAVGLVLGVTLPAAAETSVTTTETTVTLDDGTVVTTTVTVTITTPDADEPAFGDLEPEPEDWTEDGQDFCEPFPGGWQINEDAPAAVLSENVQAAFDKATAELLGVTYTPLALIGQQLVAGMNYAILCRCTPVVPEPVSTLAVLTVYADLQGGATVTDIANFDLGYYAAYGQAEPEAEPEAENPLSMFVGGWGVPSEYTAIELPEGPKEAFDAATEMFVGNDLVPMAYLGSQVVAGMNYAILCHSSLVTLEPVVSMQLVFVYADLEGNATITNIVTLNPAETTSPTI